MKALKTQMTKNRRITNPDLIKFIRENCPCIVTGQPAECVHHVRSRGAYGQDVVENLMPLTIASHTEIHKVGLTRMSEKYESVKTWLTKAGWEFNGRKWRR
jgi:hypothetical protein